MKKIYLIAAVLAIACGALVYLYFSNLEIRVAEAEKEHAAPVIEMTDVVVAITDIPPLTEITEKMIQIQRFPADYVQEGVAREAADVLGLQADGTIVKGQMIMTTAIGSLEEVVSGLSARVPEGMRAMTISVDTSSGVGGYVNDGDRVDLICYIEGDEENEIPPETVFAASGAEVLKVGNRGYTGEDGGLYTSLTLALTPAQTLKIYELMNRGSIYFTLEPMVPGGEAE